ncbi:MAG: hypothetical protein LAO18_07130 [Acidobacteriia bacterium]|nr:hypothetical protein [Terriglobia bacterium]
MTQLNLSGRQSNNPQQKSAAEPEGGSIKNQTVGALGALAMFAAVIVIGSCSRGSKPVAVQQPIQPAAPVSTPAVTPAPAPAPVAKAKAKRRRAATLSYVNREYGLSFDFPRNYRLKTGNAVNAASGPTQPAQMNFVQPGGMTLAAVEMPGNSYPGTDFTSGTINVNVNPGMTSEACAQFALPEPAPGTDASSRVRIEEVKIGATEFHEVENPSGATMKKADNRYYHVFNHGACYEFALGIGTDNDVNVEEITPVDRQQVFGKLEKILVTVKFQPVLMPESAAPVPSVAATTPADSSTTPEHEVPAPNF